MKSRLRRFLVTKWTLSSSNCAKTRGPLGPCWASLQCSPGPLVGCREPSPVHISLPSDCAFFFILKDWHVCHDQALVLLYLFLLVVVSNVKKHILFALCFFCCFKTLFFCFFCFCFLCFFGGHYCRHLTRVLTVQ